MSRADQLILNRLLENAAQPAVIAKRVTIGRGVDIAAATRALRRHGYRVGALAHDRGWSSADGYLHPGGDEVEIAPRGVTGPLEFRHWAPDSNHETGPTKVLRSTSEAVAYLAKLHSALPSAHDWRKAPDIKNRLHQTMRRR